MQGRYEPGHRVYYRDNGAHDTGTVIDTHPDAVTVRWDNDGTEDEYDLDEIVQLPSQDQPPHLKM